MTKTRLPEFDVLKGIGIVLVVLGHVTHLTNLSTLIYSFHMPLFFMLTGFFDRPKDKYIWNQFKSLMVPYFAFALLSFAYWFFIESRFRPEKAGVDAFSQFCNIFYPMNMSGKPGPYVFNVVLWFLPCLFVTSVFSHYLTEFKKSSYYVLFVLLILVVFDTFISIELPFYLTQMLYASPFFVLGKYFGLYKKSISEKSRNISPWWILLLIVPYILVWNFGVRCSMRCNIYPNSYLLFFFIGAVLVLCTYFFSIQLNNKVLQWLGVNSLAIMVLHEPLKRIIIYGFSKVSHMQTEAIRESILFSLIITVIVIASCFPVTLFLNKNCKFLFGKF